MIVFDTIYSPPISLSKISVAPTTPAPELVLGMSVCVCTFRIFLEQRAVIRFLMPKGLCASAIAAKLKSVYETEELALSTVKKGHKPFAEGRALLSDDPKSGRPLTNDLAEAISSMSKERPYLSCKVLCRHFRIAKGTCLRILHGTLGMKKLHLGTAAIQCWRSRLGVLFDAVKVRGRFCTLGCPPMQSPKIALTREADSISANTTLYGIDGH
jgi:hypothetical protein